ncbi:alpha/beta-hydrolase [Trametes versicolor FP-101664 SS1]|uniref:alpha/beta-hydrolase n=1 Tax=Trametes versicolor (strain FP-101664) TaxID=717944 RepID=UPI0004622BB3|nr:alpha/beta-hydrolase [Trametes versicolor FP-101664 SS1]EIW62596.1 alpha/beta-hydrolase [Trametes versicolor FP-101664 SS1]
MDAALYKDTKVSRGLTYHYFYSPATAGYPTLLFVHGFPSSSFDWHRQVEYFRPKGYGLLVPDNVGAGGTSKPDDPDAFRLALIARDIVDLLDAEGLEKVIGIGHDWGSAILARLANLFDERFHAYAWIAIGYWPPSPSPMDVDALIEYLKAQTGDPCYGYWKFFSSDDAHVVCERNIDSFLQLVYPEHPEVWSEWLTPLGNAQQWVEENRTPGIPAWLTQEEYGTLRETLVNGNLRSLLNVYKGIVRNLNVPDDERIPQEAWTIRKPALSIFTLRDAAGPPALQKQNTEKYLPYGKVVELDVGHWVQFEATEQLNAELGSWIEGLGLQGPA